MALFAFDPQSALVAGDDLLADRQSQSQVIAFTRCAVMGAVEALEDFGLFIGGNTHTGIADADPNFIFIQLGAQRDYAARRCRLDRPCAAHH